MINLKRFLLVFTFVVGILISLFATQAHAIGVIVYCSVEGTAKMYNPVSNEANQLMPKGCVIQLIRSKNDTTISSPDIWGVPTDANDLVIKTSTIGAKYIIISNPASGEFGLYSADGGAAGDVYYYAVRAWNGITPEGSTKYGTWVSSEGIPSNNSGTYTFYPHWIITNSDAAVPPPTISGVTGGPVVHLGNQLTINGSAFGTAGVGVYVSVNGYQVNSTSCALWSPTQVVVTVEAGMTAGSGVAIFIHKTSNSNSDTTISIDPWVTNINPSPLNNLLTGISRITYTGGGYGAARGSNGVRYNATMSNTAGYYPVWGVSTVDAIVPSGATGATAGVVTVEVNSRKSNGFAFTMATPSLTGVTPTQGNVGDSITLNGNSFGTVDASFRATAANKVTFNAGTIADGTISNWQNNAISFSVPSVVTAGIVSDVSVEAGGNYSGAQPFTVTPEITSVASPYRIGGSAMSITGTAFGASQGASTLEVLGATGTYRLTSASWGGTGTSITCNLPNTVEAAVRTVEVTVVSDGAYKTNKYTVICYPRLASIRPTSGIPGVVVTLEGYAFGDTQGTSTVSFNPSVSATILSWSNNTIEVTAPGGASSGGVKVNVVNSGGIFTSEAVTFNFGSSPAITSLNYTTRAVGQTIIITGTNFGADPGAANRSTAAYNINIGGVQVTKEVVYSWSSTQIMCEIPVGTPLGANTPIIITSGSIQSAPNTDLTVTAGGGGATANIAILHVKFNGRTYVTGEVVSSAPIITAVIEPATGETFDPAYEDVRVDNIPISVDNITYEVAPGLPAGDYQLTAVLRTPMSTTNSIGGHNITINVHNLSGDEAIWQGSVVVMGGSVQVIGDVYNYPNPFKPLSADPAQNSTRIAYNLSVDASVTLIIYDITGHEVHRAVYRSGAEGGRAGTNQVAWEGHDIFGQTLGNGMYIYKIISDNRVIASGKLVILD